MRLNEQESHRMMMERLDVQAREMRNEYEGKSARTNMEVAEKLREAERENRVLIEQIRLMENEIAQMRGNNEESNPVTMRRYHGSSGEYNIATPNFNSMNHQTTSEGNIHP